MLNFPDSPAVDQVFASGAVAWRWDGGKWVAKDQTSLSGMVAGQIPIAAGATAIASSANLSGDVSSNAALVTTLATVNSNVGTFQGLTLNAKGLVTAATNQNYAVGPATWTIGSIAFAASTSALGQDNANLFWDNTNKRLGIGTTGPAKKLHVFDATSDVLANQLLLQNQGNGNHTAGISFQVASSGEVPGYGPKAAIAFQRTAVNGGGILNFYNRGVADTAGYAATDVVMTVTGGNVGIGTAGPAAKLEIAGPAAATFQAFRISGSTTSPAYSYTVNTGGGLVAGVEGSVGGTMFASTLPYSAYIVQNQGAALHFGTSNSIRATIDSSGNFGIGTTGPGAKLQVTTVAGTSALSLTGPATTGQTAGLVAIGPAGADTTTTLFSFVNATVSNVAGTITRTGTNQVAYNTSSDERLKTDITATERGLDALLAIKVSDYKMGETSQQGLLAQQVAEHYPEAVHEGGEDADLQPWMIDYGRLTPLLIKSIQQLSDKLEAAEAEIAALRAER